MLLDLVLVGALIILNAGFSGSELALISLREGQLQRLEQRGRAGRRVATLARDPNRYLATIQIGITLAGFLASATAAVSLAEPLVDPLSFLGGAAEAVAVILVTLVLTFFTLVLGELAPKRLAMQRAERWALIAAGPLSFVQSAARPVVWILGRSSDLVVRVFGGDPDVQREEVTEEEIRDLIVAQRRFTPMQRQIMDGALEMSERPLREILIPRRDVVALESHIRAEDGRRLLVSSGHSRAPVFEADLDDVSGIVHLRDLIDTTETVGRLARPVLAIPETVALINALRQMQAQRQALAIVTNEYGGMEGIVTIEDVIEELVGEIYDETDRDVRSVQREPDG